MLYGMHDSRLTIAEQVREKRARRDEAIFGKFSSHAHYLHMMTALSTRDCRSLNDASAFLMEAFIK